MSADTVPAAEGDPGTTWGPVTGWGRTAPTTARLIRPRTYQEAADAVRDCGARGGIARGLGRAYGDAAQNAGGAVLDMTALDRIHAIDAAGGTVLCDAGVSLHRLMEVLLPLGWFVPVTPGTRYVTVGGAIGADIHGKNHHVCGSFSRHVLSFELLTADGQVRTVDRGTPLFDATTGGMGLTGVVLTATVRLQPVETALMSVDTERATDLDDLMARLTATDHRYRYSVAWIDLLARGAHTGRAVLTRGDHAPLDALPERSRARRDPLAFRTSRLPAAPDLIPDGLLSRTTVGLFNELWYRKAPRVSRGRLQRISTFFHPWTASRTGTASTAAAASCSTSSSSATTGRTPCAGSCGASPSTAARPSWPSSSASARPTRAGSPSPCPAGPSPWTSRRACRASAPSSTASTRRSRGPAAGSTSPRTPGCGPSCWTRCTRAFPTSGHCARSWTRAGCSSPTWPAASPSDPWSCREGRLRHPPVPPRPRRYVRDRARHRAPAGRPPHPHRVAGGPPSPALDRAAERLRDLGAEVRTVAFDALDPESHEAALGKVFAEGDIDMVLLAFGVLGDQAHDEREPLNAVRVAQTNYTGAVSAGLISARALQAQGHGSLVVLSSVAGERARRANFIYGSSKAGLDAFAQGLGDALHGTGVHVMVVRPGFVRSRMTEGMEEAPLATTPEAVATAIELGLRRRSETVWVPGALRVVMSALRHLPRGVFRRLPV